MKHAKRCYIYRDSLGDCTNNGITATRDTCTLFWDCEPAEALTYCEEKGLNPAECLIVDDSPSCGREYRKAVPLKEKGRGYVGPMFGGNYIECRDYFDYPIPVHDRYETWEEYDILSR